MSTNQTFSCYLIGADTLLIECAELLLAKKHNILGVITSAPRISQWALTKSLPVIPCRKGYEEALKNTDFDYLFSITHLAIIPDTVLSLPKKGAVNFHDGPLPSYAGLNAPAWALINGETQYGISWHQITPGVDEGGILKQEFFDIAPDETSLSINTKCFAAAIDSFPVLVEELACKSTEVVAQDLSKRSYFGKFKRPQANGFLPWDKSAVALEALVRALDFGDYRNLLVMPKLSLKGKVIAVAAAVARDLSHDVSPGQLLAIDEGQIDIATGEGTLSLTKLKDLNGRVISAGELQSQLDLRVGDICESLQPDQVENITTVGSQLARNDEHWEKTLATLDPVELPYRQVELTGSGPSYRKMTVNIASDIACANGNVPASHAVAGAFGMLLARLNRKHEFDLAFENSAIASVAGVAPGVFNSYALLHLGFELSDTSSQVLAITSTQIGQASERGPWANDLIGRTPELSERPELVSGTALPVAVNIGGTQKTAGSVLTLCISEDGLGAEVFFDDNCLSQKSAEKLVSQLESIIAIIVNTPEKAVGELELITQEEKKQLLETWNTTEVSYDNSQCVHHQFEARVAQHPEDTALVFEGDSISYAELNNRANQLAAVLIDQGIVPDDLVGVNVNRSIDLMVATMGVHKAGAAYVPLDPAFPADRIAYMIDDANMRLVITQESIQEDLPSSGARVICVEDISHEARENPNVSMDSTHLAYVIYTSGSTGNPKGVMVEHRNVTNFFVGMDEKIDCSSLGTWLAVTSLSFDISVLELFWTLTRGFKVVIYREDRVGGVSSKVKNRPMDFGMFLWGNDDAAGSAKYRLLTEGAKYFDQNGFDSVWTPERHFGAFGGPYRNP